MENSVMGSRRDRPPPAAGRASFDIHGGAARGLAQTAAGIHPALAQSLNETPRGGALALAERRGSHRRNVDIFAVGPVFQAAHDLQKVELGDPAHGDELIAFQGELFAPLVRARHARFQRFRGLPAFDQI
jgi:hypothetical protein